MESQKKSNSKIQYWWLREKQYQQKRGFEVGSLLFRDEKNAFIYAMIEGTVEYPGSNILHPTSIHTASCIQVAVENAGLEFGISNLKTEELSTEE